MLGIVDWGIGGIDFYRRLRMRHPDTPVVYFSDTGAAPYGKLSRPLLLARLERVIAALEKRGVTRVVVACNAASTVLPSLVSSLPIEGVIDHGIRAALKTSAKTIGVIGGVRTIRSGIYRRALASKKRVVIQRVAQPLSGFVESGNLDSPELRREIARIVAPLRNVDALVLACTHYQAIAPIFGVAIPGVVLVDPVTELLRVLPSKWALPKGPPGTRFLTTGDPQAMSRAAKLAFQVTLSARQVTI